MPFYVTANHTGQVKISIYPYHILITFTVTDLPKVIQKDIWLERNGESKQKYVSKYQSAPATFKVINIERKSSSLWKTWQQWSFSHCTNISCSKCKEWQDSPSYCMKFLLYLSLLCFNYYSTATQNHHRQGSSKSPRLSWLISISFQWKHTPQVFTRCMDFLFSLPFWADWFIPNIQQVKQIGNAVPVPLAMALGREVGKSWLQVFKQQIYQDNVARLNSPTIE